MNKILKRLSVLICGCLVAVCALSTFVNNKDTVSTPTRDVELIKQDVDYENYFDSFDNAKFEVDNSIGVFTGSKNLSDLDLTLIDNISDVDLTNQEDQSIDFKFTFNKDTQMVIIEATIISDGLTSTDSLIGYVFEDANGEIDAIITLDDDSTLLLSEFESYYIDNCGWLSNLIKNVVSTVVATVVCAIVPVAIPVIVAATVIKVGIEITEDCFAVRNYYENKGKTNQPSGIINYQSNYSNWKMGNQILSKNGCGAIASFNVMKLLNKDKYLYDVIYYYDATGGTLAFGYFGVDPTSIRSYFLAQNVSCKSYTSITSLQSGANNMSTSQYIIMCFWNNKDDITEGAHYIAIKKNSSTSKYIAYNSNESNKSTLKELYSNGSYIGGWIIG